MKLAIVGVGRMGAVHARTLAKIPEIELVAVVDPRREIVGPSGVCCSRSWQGH